MNVLLTLRLTWRIVGGGGLIFFLLLVGVSQAGRPLVVPGCGIPGIITIGQPHRGRGLALISEGILVTASEGKVASIGFIDTGRLNVVTDRLIHFGSTLEKVVLAYGRGKFFPNDNLGMVGAILMYNDIGIGFIFSDFDQPKVRGITVFLPERFSVNSC